MSEISASASAGEPAIPKSSAPDSFSIQASGFDTEEHAIKVAEVAGDAVRALSRYLDLSQLDGVTVAYDYHDALLRLDRGYQTTYQLSASKEDVVGIAMAATVIRGGSLKSHLVLNAAYFEAFEDPKQDGFQTALHFLAHECSHVEVTHQFDSAFPGVLLRKRYDSLRDTYRWQTILACWDEYAATRLSGRYGQPPTEAYEDTFLKFLQMTKPRATELVEAFQDHRSVDQLISDVYKVYGDLMKFAAYHLGNLTGQGLSFADMPRTVEALTGHWFAPYCDRLGIALANIADEYGTWPNQAKFEVIGDIVDDLLSLGGVHYVMHSDGRLQVVLR